MDDLNDILRHYQKDQKVNYDHVLKQVIANWEKQSRRPSVLLHTCCAPCSTYTLEYLTRYATITVFFSNSNIYPESEYQRRMAVQQQFINDFNHKTQNTVGFLAAPYQPNQFLEMVAKNQLNLEKEGGLRCKACFEMRLDSVAKKAQELGYDYFGSALTLSPYKNSQLINTLGLEVQKIYDTRYLPSDFKKNGGFLRSIEMCEEYDIYRQCYCGCIFAARQQGVDLKQTDEDARAFMQEKIKCGS